MRTTASGKHAHTLRTFKLHQRFHHLAGLACTRLHASISPIRSLKLYRVLRPFVGPVFAWRVSFGGRA